MKAEKETGFFRRQWNYFKRGKSELNFILNIYQTIIIIWGVGTITQVFNNLISFSILFAFVLFLLSLAIGKYSLTVIDTALPYINPFSQDIVIFRGLLAEGLELMASGDTDGARESFRRGIEITDKWTAEK